MRKVVLAMSGGVDSSAAAALLKRDGFKVIGVFMKFWAEGCCSPESEKRARLVAKKLGLPFYVFDFRKEFKKKIVGYFLTQSKQGLTPNPCVVCNKEIKFDLLFKKFPITDELIATGHYARVKNGRLFKAKDKKKDQSYFLWRLNKKILDRALFPVGEYDKKEVKKMAKKFGLPAPESESQEACFIQTSLADFLSKYLKNKPGEIVCNGKIVGEHNGLWFYTTGQRKGIGLAGGPYYVADKDVKNNKLIVTKKEKDLFRKELIAKDINWLRKESFPLEIMAKIRYKNKSFSAKVLRQDKKVKAVFSKPQRAVTPGQSVVFYKGQELLGGGVIT